MEIDKIVSALRLSRPFTLIAPLVGGLTFSYLGYLDSGSIDPSKILLTAIVFVLANYASNVINQIYDRDIDAINKPYRPIPSGKISVDEASSIAILLTIATISIAYVFVGTLFGSMLSVIMIFSWLYSSPPLRLRSRLFWSNLSLAAPRGALGILTAYASYSNPFENPRLLMFSLGMAVYVFGGNTFKDFHDENGDRMCGVRNFVTVYGRKKAMMISNISIVASLIPIFLSTSFANILLVSPMVMMMIYFSLKNPEMKAGTENTIIWAVFYLCMTVLFLGYAFI